MRDVNETCEATAGAFAREMADQGKPRHFVLIGGVAADFADGDAVSRAATALLDRCAATQFRLVVVHCCSLHWLGALEIACLTRATVLAFQPEGCRRKVAVYLTKRTEGSLRAVLGAVCNPSRWEGTVKAPLDLASPWQVVYDLDDATAEEKAWLDANLVPYLDARLAAGRA